MKKNKGKYPTPKRIKSGRNLFVLDYDGKPLVGLSWDSGNGQYFYTFWKSEKDIQTGRKTRKDYSFGVHYGDAVFKFRQWVRDTQKLSLIIPDDIQTEQVVTKKLSPAAQQNLQDIYNDLGVDKEAPTDLTYTGENIEPANGVSILNTIKTDKQYALHLIKQLLQDDELRIETIRLLKLNDLLPAQYKF
jgi:hypothetical protein